MTHEMALLPFAAGGAALAAAWTRWTVRRLRAPFGLGDRMPAFRGLPAADGRRVSLADVQGSRALVVLFTSNRCPGAKAYDGRLAAIHAERSGRGVRFLAVNPVSEALHPTESLAEMASAARERELPYAYVKDEGQRLARALGAACTPHAFLFGPDLRLRYHGRIDNAFVASRASRHHLRDALDDVLAGRAVRVPETAPLGCSIEWAAPADPRTVPRG